MISKKLHVALCSISQQAGFILLRKRRNIYMQLSVSKKKHRKQLIHKMTENRALYLMILPAFIYILIFSYWPMYGVQIAFRDFNFADGITGSKWVGLKWFKFFFNSNNFSMVVRNTLILSFYDLLAGFPVPIILALIMNAIPSKRFRKVSQTITYLPHFISVIVLVGMMSSMFSVNSGWVNTIIKALGGTPTYIMGEAKYFRHVYVWSGVWQQMGWSSIIYLAALTGIDPGLHEAAMIDGANKLRRIWHIDIPGILPTVSIMLILSFGNIMSLGFDKVYSMQNSLNYSVSEVLSTHIYKMGIQSTKYSYSAAVSLFNNVINFIMLITVNKISDKLSGNSLW